MSNFSELTYKDLAERLAHYLSSALVSAQYSMTDETMHDALGLCDQVTQRKAAPVPPAGDVPEYFVAACDKFDWTPEEALRFYAEGKHFDTADGRTRILCTGAIASHALKGLAGEYADMKGIEPAGDVEVLGYKHVTRTGYEVVTEKDHPPVIPGAVWVKAIALVDHAHAVWAQADAAEADELRRHFQEGSEKFEADVTRLTAERDEIRAIKDSAIESVALLHAERVGLLAEVKRYKTMSDNYCALNMDAQSELTKARELLPEMRRQFERANFVKLGKLINEALAHQSAPAAKGGSDE